MSDPRMNIGYARMQDTIDLIQRRGPQTIEAICSHLGISHDLFKEMRYGLPGRLALEDSGVSIPRPVAKEGYVYKIADTFRSGNVKSDGEANDKATLIDAQTRLSTAYIDFERLEDLLPKSEVRTVVKDIRMRLYVMLKDTDKVAKALKIKTRDSSQWSQHVLEKIS